MKCRNCLLLILLSVTLFIGGCSFDVITSEKTVPKLKVSNHSSKKIQLMKEYMFCRRYCSKHYIVNLVDDPTNSNDVILSWKGMNPFPTVITIKNYKTGIEYPINSKASEASLEISNSKKDNEFQIHFEWGHEKFGDQVTRVIKIER